MRVGVGTIVAGRREHLQRQAAAIARLPGVERYIVVAMDEQPVTVAAGEVLRVSTDPPGKGRPLAAARNRAVEALDDCDLVVLLDVDCIPGSELLHRYADAGRALGAAPGLLCGPVGYLDSDAAGSGEPLSEHACAAARQRVIRDFPGEGVRREPRPELFWSLSFAVAPSVHTGLGGFDEAYVGWGAEDTDYGLRAARAGVGLWLVGGAWAYHQAHPPSPPDELGDVAANARRFHARWGFWPMPDVLGRLASQGRLDWTPDGERCTVPGLLDGGARDAAQLRASRL